MTTDKNAGISLKDLALLLSVARAGSFAAAARQSDLDPSGVGRVVAQIEATLGVRLFERSTRRMSLTEAGHLYLERITPLLDEIEHAGEEARSVRAEPRGTLRISASVTFGQRVLVPKLAEFRTRFPLVGIEGVFTDANLDLVTERIDLAVRLGPTVQGEIVATKWLATRYRVVASAAYLAQSAALNCPMDLEHHRCLLHPLKSFRSRWLFRDSAGKVIEQPVMGDLVLSPAGAVHDAALQGLGPALLADWLVDDDLLAGRLVHCLKEWDVTATTFDTGAWLIYPSRVHLPAKTRAMIEFLKGD